MHNGNAQHSDLRRIEDSEFRVDWCKLAALECSAIKIAWIEARKEIAHANIVISDCRARLDRMGIDCDEFEESLGDE